MNQRDYSRIMSLSVGERLEYDLTQTWVDLFRAQIRMHPTHPAVVAENGTLSYSELDDLSDRLAGALIDTEGVQPNEFIAVRMGRVKEFHVAVLAIHKAGAAYMPIDLEYSEERVQYMLEDSGARLTLTEERVARMLERKPVCAHLAPRCAPDSRAYMIYTSGSTGNIPSKPTGQRPLRRCARRFNPIWTSNGRWFAWRSSMRESATCFS